MIRAGIRPAVVGELAPDRAVGAFARTLDSSRCSPDVFICDADMKRFCIYCSIPRDQNFVETKSDNIHKLSQ